MVSWTTALASAELHRGEKKGTSWLGSHSTFGVQPGLLTPKTLRGGEGYNPCHSCGFHWEAGWTFRVRVSGAAEELGLGGAGCQGRVMGAQDSGHEGGGEEHRQDLVPKAWGRGYRREWLSQFWPGSRTVGLPPVKQGPGGGQGWR